VAEYSLDELPPDVKREAMLYIEFLMNKRAAPPGNARMKLSWAGALEEFKDQYTSVELQHKAAEWR
jgi:Protein of unknown function (DUF2281)